MSNLTQTISYNSAANPDVPAIRIMTFSDLFFKTEDSLIGVLLISELICSSTISPFFTKSETTPPDIPSAMLTQALMYRVLSSPKYSIRKKPENNTPKTAPSELSP